MREIGRAKLIGTTARESIARRDFSGRVLAVVTGAVYLQAEPRSLEENEILWLVQNHVPMHTRAIRGSFDLTALKVGMSFGQQGGSLCFENQASLDLANASDWRPAAIRPEQLVRREIVKVRVGQLMSVIQTLDCGDSLGQVILLIRAIANGDNVQAVRRSSSLITAAFRPIKEIAFACHDHDMARIVEFGRALVGLGPGLTPSGDDFLGGLAFVAFHLKSAYSGELWWEQLPLVDLIDWAGTRTNRISHALLRDHILGQGAEPLHDLIAAVLRDKGTNELMTDVARLVQIGHTTGWDILAGAVMAMSTLVGPS